MRLKLVPIVLLVLICVGASGVLASDGVIERVSVASDTTQGNAYSWVPSTSANGRYVAFVSSASNLVPSDTNGAEDVFIRDRLTNTTTMVSISDNGTQGNSDSAFPSISGDGRYVVFLSWASNLVPNDINGQPDIFIRDRQTNTTTMVSISDNGTQGNSDSAFPSISGDGRYVVFLSNASNLVPNDTNNQPDIFIRDLQTNTTTRVSVASDGTQGNGISTRPCISNDGRYVAFYSDASNLVPNDINGCSDVFVRDRQTNTTTIVSVSDNGTQSNNASGVFDGPSISIDGRYVAFSSAGSNLVPSDTNNCPDVFVRDRQTNTTTIVSVASDGTQGNSGSNYASISNDSRYVAFSSYASNLVPGDTNGQFDIFVHDQQTNTTTLASVASDGTQGNTGSQNPSISGDGQYVAFDSRASNLVPNDTNGASDIFIRDRQTNTTTLVSVSDNGTQGNSTSILPSISGDGRYIAFESLASNLVPNDTNGHTDIFVRDRQTNTTTLVSVSDNGTQANDECYQPCISADGRYVAFFSGATNLVPNDTNGLWDVFVHDRQTHVTTRVSVASDGTQANNVSLLPSISGDGRYVAFESDASNLVPNNTNGGVADIFVRDRQTNTTSIVSVSDNGTQGNATSTRPCISNDGRYIAYHSWASNLVLNDTNGVTDIFVRDRQTNTTSRVSVASDGTQANGGSFSAGISDDGRYVAFSSDASNLVPNDTNGAGDIFIRDRQTNTTTRVSVASDGTQANGSSYLPGISDDGQYIAFDSYANNLIPGDANNCIDVFISDRQTNTTTRVSVASDGTQGNSGSQYPSISNDGRYVAFLSAASNLVPGDTNGVTDVFVAVNPLYQSPEAKTYINEEYCFSLQYPGDWVERPELVTTPLHLSAFGVSGFVPDVVIAALDADAPMSVDWILESFNDMGYQSPKVVSPLTETTLADGTEATTYKANYITPSGYEVVAFCLDADRCDKRIRILVFTIDAFAPYDETLFSEIAHTLTFTCTCGQPELPPTPNPTPNPAPAPRASPALPRQLNQAQISLQYLSVNPQQAAVNQPLTIAGNVVNTGDQAGNYNLALKINGQVEQTRMVSVGPKGTQPVKFTVAKSKPGTYTVDLGGQRASFAILEASHNSGSNSRGGLIAILIIGILILATVVMLLLSRRTA